MNTLSNKEHGIHYQMDPPPVGLFPLKLVAPHPPTPPKPVGKTDSLVMPSERGPRLAVAELPLVRDNEGSPAKGIPAKPVVFAFVP